MQTRAIDVNCKRIQPRKTKLPPARHFHTLVAFQNDLYLFGGLDSNGIALNDLWKFSSSNLRGEKWKQLKTKNTPTPRHSHQAVILNHKMFVFGGVCYGSSASSELYCFDFENNTWALVKKFDKCRTGHSMVVHRNSIVIFGGSDERSRTSSSVLVINNKHFTITEQYGQGPPARKYSSIVLLDGAIYIYGGLRDEALGDFYRISTALAHDKTLKFTLESLSIPSFVPPLYGATLTVSPVNNTHLILVGGLSNETSPNKHIFTFSTTSSEWHGPFTLSQCPTARWYHQSCTVGRQMFVFGGLSETENDGLNDLWIIGDDNIFGESKSRADLPNEIWTMILRNLDNEDIPATSVVSKSFLQLIKSDEKLTRVLNDRIGFLNIEVLPINKEIYIAIVGDTRVGKSASIIQFCAGIFVEIHNPTLEENWRKQFSINGNTYLLDALDTGPELPQDITRKWYQNSHAFYAVYDITRPETLTNLTEHLKVVQEVIHKSTFPLIIVGNKADLEEQRMVSQQEGQEFAKKHGALWAETSAKMREVAFETLLEHVVELELRQRKAGGKNLSKSNKKDRCSVM